jgi:hypothetical protein
MTVKAYYGDRISENMTETPEGYLICHNVPIGRTGWQEYLGQEIGQNDLYDHKVQVYRSPEEVFHPAAIASFEGKSTTDEHPSDWVRPDNYSSLEKGHVTNVRRGSGEDANSLLADLIIKDPKLISNVKHGGKREVSCGYNAVYIPIPGEDAQFAQTQIRGNHVAIVGNGRAGHEVAIKDSADKLIERGKRMNIVQRMFSALTKDGASPEELLEAAKVTNGAPADDSLSAPATMKPMVASAIQDEGEGVDPAISALTAKIDALTAVVSQLVQSESEAVPQGLEALEKELGGDGGDTSEAAVTLSPEQITDSDPGPGPVAPDDTLPENPIPGADRATMLNAVRTMKTVIAKIPDAKTRQQVSDSLAKSFRTQLATKAPTQIGGYAQIQKAQVANAKAATQDKAIKADPELDGKNWREKFNPHYKKEVK